MWGGVEGKWGEEAGREEGRESVVSMKIVLSNSKINKLHLQKKPCSYRNKGQNSDCRGEDGRWNMEKIIYSHI